MKKSTQNKTSYLCSSLFIIVLTVLVMSGTAFTQDAEIDIPETLLVTAGSFTMGTDMMDADGFTGATAFKEYPAHDVTITYDYYMGKYEITQAQWLAVTGR